MGSDGNRWVNPDCEQGKHQACSGTAWDEEHDCLTGCGCSHHVEILEG